MVGGRRNFLRLLTGATAASVTMGVKDAAKALGVGTDALNPGGPSVADLPVGAPSRHNAPRDRAMRLLWQTQQAARGDPREMSVSIREKKSWSPAFKQSCHSRETAIHNAIVEKIENDDDFAAKLLDVLGMKG